MGCNGSTDKGGGAAAGGQNQRRRLSVGHVEGGKDDLQTDVSDADRGLFTTLDQESLMELLANDDRKFSIGSNTDNNTKQSFAPKSTHKEGVDLDPVNLGIGYTCRKGLKPESPNQDSWFVLKIDAFSIYAVLDGHGKTGHDCSQFVKENLPKLIVKQPAFKSDDMKQMMIDIFKKLQSLLVTADRMGKVSAQLAGTTATVVIHDHARMKITVAHVADSTSILARYNLNRTAVEAIVLTRDHKPDLKDERKRIERNGGRVVFDGYANHRVYSKKGKYPGLNMSRCLGDIMGHDTAGITCEPEVSERILDDHDVFLLLCSDGVWEFISPQEAVDIVKEFSPKDALKATDGLAKEAWDRWIKEEGGMVVDDITVVLVYPHFANGPQIP